MPYKSVQIPDDLAPTEYNYTERRAELFRMIVEAGHPDLVNQTQMAQYYGVNQSTISRDLDAIREELNAELGTDAELITAVIYEKAIKEQAKAENWTTAVDIIESWWEWLFETGAKDRAPEKHQLDHDGDFSMPELGDKNEEHFDTLIDRANAELSDTVVDGDVPATTPDPGDDSDAGDTEAAVDEDASMQSPFDGADDT